jgi:hypothetical protein
MPQPKSKAQIVKRLQAERRRLEQNLAGLTADEMLLPGAVGPWSVKDVLAHLADWEARMPGWVAASRRGETVQTPEPGLTWKQVDAVNQRIYERHRDRPLDEVLAYFRETHDEFMAMVETMPEEEMLERGRYAFTGGSAVYDWLTAYAAHDLWGKTKLRAWIKARSQH